MPYDGLFSFLHNIHQDCRKVGVRVNALWRAFFISTSMFFDFDVRMSVCQCPMTGFFHFYRLSAQGESVFKAHVSMPYDGLFSFLRSLKRLHRLCRRRWCQCPMTGFFHFYYCSDCYCNSRSSRCQCPMTGFFHFYSRKAASGQESQDGVNALWRAFFISTLRTFSRKRAKESPVSMPYDGLFSFLLRRSYPQSRQQIMCQCPMTGFFHFYRRRPGIQRNCWGCQCPMTGFFHFYGIPTDEVHAVCGCQCPMTGFFHFYEETESKKLRKRYDGVNALWRAFFISTDINLRSENCYIGVNALWRAFFISTLPAENADGGSAWCQCPMTGFFHFYSIKAHSVTTTWTVSMPYDGLFSFLHVVAVEEIIMRDVSMPYDGLFSFLHMVRVQGLHS